MNDSEHEIIKGTADKENKNSFISSSSSSILVIILSEFKLGIGTSLKVPERSRDEGTGPAVLGIGA